MRPLLICFPVCFQDFLADRFFYDPIELRSDFIKFVIALDILQFEFILGYFVVFKDIDIFGRLIHWS